MKKFIIYALFLLILSILLSCQEKQPRQSHINSIGMKMIRINPGSFLMGDQQGVGDWDEQPVHQVSLSQPFYISQTEIFIEQFQKFKPEYMGSDIYAPYATGISWNEANAFCQWLSEKEGKDYRLPTEAEWEYVCRAGTSTSFSCGEDLPEDYVENDWGIKNMHHGPLEWCQDWYGDYLYGDSTGPVGRSSGLVRVVRGGLPDNTAREYDHPVNYYQRSANRSGMAPAFSHFSITPEEDSNQTSLNKTHSGLIGLHFSDSALRRQGKKWPIDIINSDKLSWNTQNDWSARWVGYIKAPASGNIIFIAEADNGIILKINDQTVIEGWGEGEGRSGEILMTKGENYPIDVSYYKDGGQSYLRLYWQWGTQDKEIIPTEALSYHSDQENMILKELRVAAPGQSIDYPIGFRVVQGSMPSTEPTMVNIPFAKAGVKQSVQNVKRGPNPKKPYYRKRILLPTPLENQSRETIDAAGFHPSFRGHNHSPAMEVCSNGDVLLVIYTSYHEYEPGVSFIASRLRFGADHWDMPSPYVDLPDINDHAPLLWNDNNKLYLFWGNPRMNSAFPFQWITSEDNGSSFSDVHFPNFLGFVGPHSRQPINTTFRDRAGNIYLASDGEGGSSVLWQSSDDGETWKDPQSRSAGRHTTYVLLKNGDILGMGGKNTNIDGFMPQAISRDGGKSWKVSKTVFPALASNQRPTIIRLKSGRLFFATDFQKRGGDQPKGIEEKGALVALSEDEGRSWHIKKLVGTLAHEKDTPWGETIGYSVARQAPNGIIHLITTMNQPCLHFAMNEAWILADEEDSIPEKKIMQPSATTILNKKNYRENYATGEKRIEYSAGIANDGRFLKDGLETWYYQSGQRQYESSNRLGVKIGSETYWDSQGNLVWEWIHEKDGRSKWTQWWPNGNKKSESSWRVDMVCEGPARCWNYEGNLISDVIFVNGKISK